jgi:hypothetical protein
MTETQEYPLPTVHLNGTSKESLLQGNVKILSAINELREAIGSCQFHGRDYYVQDVRRGLSPVTGGTFDKAYDERCKHLNNIGDFEQYIEKHIQHIITQ